MRKVFKVIGAVFGIIVLLLIIAAFLLTTFIKANDIKPIISKQVYKATGKKLIFQSDLRWTFFPNIGIECGKAVLSEGGMQNLKQPFASIDRAKVSVRLLPLLTKKVEANEVIVDGLTVNIIKEAQSKTANLSAQVNENVAKMDEKESSPSIKSSAEHKKTDITADFSISQLQVKNLTLSWKDLKTGKDAKISGLNFNARNISPRTPFPVNLTMNIHNSQPKIDGQAALTGNMQLNLKKQQFILSDLNFNAALKGSGLPDKKLDCSLKAELQVEPNSLEAKQINLILNKSVITGYIKINDFKKLAARFNLVANKLNLDDWIAKDKRKDSLGRKGLPSKGKQPSYQESSAASESSSAMISFLKESDIQGKVFIKELTVFKTHANQVKVEVSSNRSGIIVSPITANLYQGSLQGNVELAVGNSSPIIKQKMQFNNIDIQPLLYDLLGYEKLYGTAFLQMNLTTKSFNSEAMLSNLNGNMQFAIKNGTVHGIDVVYFIKQARALSKKKPTPKMHGPDQTNFGNLTGTAVITNGVLTNNDLHLLSKGIEVKGHGTANLVSRQLDYNIEANDPDAADEWIVPVKVTGSFNRPKQRIEIDRILKTIVKHQIQKQIDDNLKLLKIGTLLQ